MFPPIEDNAIVLPSSNKTFNPIPPSFINFVAVNSPSWFTTNLLTEFLANSIKLPVDEVPLFITKPLFELPKITSIAIVPLPFTSKPIELE